MGVSQGLWDVGPGSPCTQDPCWFLVALMCCACLLHMIVGLEGRSPGCPWCAWSFDLSQSRDYGALYPHSLQSAE